MSKKLDIFVDTECPSLELLTSYMEDRMPPAQRQQLELHMLDCPMCADALEGLEWAGDAKRVSGTVQRIRTESKRRLYEQDPYREKSSKRRYRAMPKHFVQYAASAAAAIFILWMGVFIYRDLNQASVVYGEHFQAEAMPSPATAPLATDTLQQAAESLPAPTKQDLQQTLASADAPPKEPLPASRKTNPAPVTPKPGRETSVSENIAPAPLIRSGSEELQADDRRERDGEVVTLNEQDDRLEHDENTGRTYTDISPLGTVADPMGDKLATEEIEKKAESTVAASPDSFTLADVPAASLSTEKSRAETGIANYSQAQGYSPQAPYQDPDMASGLTLFENKKYEQALSAFELVLKRFPDFTHAQYMAAQSYLELKKPEKALVLLKTVTASKDSPYFYDAQWKLAGAYLLHNRKQPAIRVLKKIETEGGPYQAKAQAALADL